MGDFTFDGTRAHPSRSKGILGDMIPPVVAILPSGLTLVLGIGVVFVVLVKFLVLIPEFSS